ncbi:MAG: discoidin domain-containing protein [Acidobacteriota bacterium]
MKERLFGPKESRSISRREFLGGTAGAAALSMIPARDLAKTTAGEHASHASAAMTAPGLNPPGVRSIRVDAVPGHIANSFDPDQALGSSMDILYQDPIEKVYTPEMVKECLSAGWGPITYRQNTELQIAAWHWNPIGTWSDPGTKSGYFTGSAEPTEFLRNSYGYPLPHRGNTRNGGSARGYSRMTDGDPSTYWKSNPYLTSKFTGEPNSLHPQWVVIDFGHDEEVNALRIDWTDPYAIAYLVEYWTGEDAMGDPTEGTWNAFPNGVVKNGHGGSVTLRLASLPVKTRFLRILMTESSNTCDTHGDGDPRNCVGYAIKELFAGTHDGSGRFVDIMQHAPEQYQTATYCSSIDPWHSASDLNMEGGDQTGFDLFFTSGITNDLPAMIPVSMLYGSSPEDSANQIAYLKKRGYPVAYVEMGEEPDGQYCTPEDYAALYLQWATAIHRVDPKLKLGGPIFEGVNEDIKVWPDAEGRTSWFGRFLDYLKSHGRLADLAFMSFEHYPFPPCGVTWSDLYREPEVTQHILDVWRKDGLPAGVPMFSTESNLSWGLTPYMVDIFSALWLADSVGAFLTAGGSAYYHSPIQPEPLRPGCHGWGTYGNFVANRNLEIQQHTAQYHASRLINLEWVKHGAGKHDLYHAASDIRDEAGHVLVTAYAARRPDGDWSVMIVNKDKENDYRVRPEFEGLSGRGSASFSGPVTQATFGSAQYVWRPDGEHSRADPDLPPVLTAVPDATGASFALPRSSVTILRGKVEGPAASRVHS